MYEIEEILEKNQILNHSQCYLYLTCHISCHVIILCIYFMTFFTIGIELFMMLLN
jgi:hypothetical protein